MVLSIVSILLIIVVLMLLWILLGSFTLTIDTQSHDYSVRAFGVLKGCVLMRDGHLFIEIEVPFYQKSIDVEAAFLKSAAQTKRIQEPKAKKKTKSSSAFFKRKIQKNGLRVLRSFKIKKCYANIDTNDCSLNGRLYPLTSLARYFGFPVHINFLGKQQITLIIENRLANILRAALN